MTGGALIVVGEDYGDGSSIIQERSHAFAMKSQVWLIDPRPSLPAMVRAVEKGFELSEASSTPVMLELRIRACHVHGSFATGDNREPAWSRRRLLDGPRFDYARVCLPPSTYLQEREKVTKRWPAALGFIREHGLNEHFPACGPDAIGDLGILTQGGMYNALLRALALLGFTDEAGGTRIRVFVLNVTYPLVSEEVTGFCAGKRAVLVVEEGQPDFLEEAIGSLLRKADLNTRLLGKGPFPMAGEYTGEVVASGSSGVRGSGFVQIALVVEDDGRGTGAHGTDFVPVVPASLEIVVLGQVRAVEIVGLRARKLGQHLLKGGFAGVLGIEPVEALEGSGDGRIAHAVGQGREVHVVPRGVSAKQEEPLDAKNLGLGRDPELVISCGDCRRLQRLRANELADAGFDPVEVAEDQDGSVHPGSVPSRHGLQLSQDFVEVRAEVGQDVVGIAGDPVTCMNPCGRPADQYGFRQEALQPRGRGEDLLPVRWRLAGGRLGHSASRSGTAGHTDWERGRDRRVRFGRAGVGRPEVPGASRPSPPIVRGRSRRQWPQVCSAGG